LEFYIHIFLAAGLASQPYVFHNADEIAMAILTLTHFGGHASIENCTNYLVVLDPSKHVWNENTLTWNLAQTWNITGQPTVGPWLVTSYLGQAFKYNLNITKELKAAVAAGQNYFDIKVAIPPPLNNYGAVTYWGYAKISTSPYIVPFQ
jgi:hypothetical protein